MLRVSQCSSGAQLLLLANTCVSCSYSRSRPVCRKSAPTTSTCFTCPASSESSATTWSVKRRSRTGTRFGGGAGLPDWRGSMFGSAGATYSNDSGAFANMLVESTTATMRASD